MEPWMPNSPRLRQSGSLNSATPVVPSLKKKVLKGLTKSSVLPKLDDVFVTLKQEHPISPGMQMSTDPNHYGVFPQSFYSQHVVSFQTSAISNGSGAMPVCLDTSNGMNGNLAMLNTTPSTIVSTGSPNMIADSSQTLKYGGPMAVEWSYPELQMLNDGLHKYANEPGIMKYIKIAAMLPEKTVRDVAMRCQWIAKKENTRRRKTEEHYHGKRIKDRKEKMAESSLWTTNHPVQTDIRGSSIPSASDIDRAMLNILEENAQLLNQIEANILTSQAQNNIDLFHRTRRNINDLLQSMSQIPGIMSKMPQLPVSVDEKLASYLLPGVNLGQVLGSSHLKQEPRGW
ncbi:uncharacterized protein LOC100845515 isoform X2 [Brachypodium distachyon]|uniref:Myb-like domain-containing protein n=1 Tax=Brachypodium distachyon TaxID=15368 RepID=I1IBT7_BRADI|nr:uncharacterized protein LOC100845515 isoform X2 [Brachypodium distachyon]KQK00437.1 hypothetical protein BRADI_3g49420v3 [Brachypodium distachyon]|eukprot:XP_010235738.1 uncharacterized protein LOC100845515 isoform X2 [Brachypodium distachyon]